MSVNAVAIFCEDIRQELTGQVTLVGIMPDTIRISQIPTLVPRLSVYVRVHITVPEQPNEISAKLVGANSAPFPPLNWKKDAIEKAFTDLRAKKVPFAGFVARSSAALFPIHQEGLLSVIVSIDGKEYTAGAINIITSPNASVQPASQSQSAS